MSSDKKVVLPLLRRRTPLPAFLADRLYIDFRNDHFTALAKLAGVIHKIPPGDLAGTLQQRRPKSLTEVGALLRAAGFSDLVYIDREDYETMRSILKRHGVLIEGEHFDVIPRAKKSLKRLPTRKLKK